MIKTKFTEMFGIEKPIVQGGMQHLGIAEFASLVCNAGGMGTINITCYPGIEKETQQLAPNGHFKEELTVTDQAGHLVTSRGPATAWAYAFAIAEALGLDTKTIKQDTLYDYLKENI